MSGVIHVVAALERGGAQRVALETAVRLHDKGRPQILIAGPSVAGAGLDEEAHARLGNRLVRLPDLGRAPNPLRDIAALQALVRLIDVEVDRVGSPVVVHTHTSKAGVLGRLAAHAVRGAYSVHTVHGFGLDALGPKHRWALEAAERVSGACDVAVFVCEADRVEAERLGLFGGAQSRVIRAGIEPERFTGLHNDDARRRAVRATLGIPHGARVATTVANLKQQKDPLFHVEVLAAWRRRNPDAHLVFAGDGPLRAEVEARARAHGVQDALHLLGFVDDPRDALAAADAYLLASAWEGLPCSVLEATAAGLPCIVRDTGWAADLAWTKSVVPLPRDASPDAFALALNDIVTKAPRAKKIPREFTQRGMLDNLRALYDELLGPPRPSERERFAMRRRR